MSKARKIGIKKQYVPNSKRSGKWDKQQASLFQKKRNKK